MEVMTIVGFSMALVIGVSLGIIGGGGSILTVPIFVYLLGIDPVTATAYSLFVVGSTALVGAVKRMMVGTVSYRTAVVFAIPSFIAVYLTRRYLVPAIPNEIFASESFILTKDIAILLLFALTMVLAAITMIRSGRKEEPEEHEIEFNYPMIMIEGLGVGVLTGLVGAGGGFLIIPALVLLARLPIKLAIGTSLLIISVKSLVGFIGDMGTDLAIDWNFLLIFSSISIVGIFLGNYLSQFISSTNLKKGFGWFVLIMGAGILVKELASGAM